jgi:hypothetical protein
MTSELLERFAAQWRVCGPRAGAPETGESAANRMIVEVALDHAPQPSSDFRRRLMHPHPKRDLHLFQLGEESLSVAFAQHEEIAVLPNRVTLDRI